MSLPTPFFRDPNSSALINTDTIARERSQRERAKYQEQLHRHEVILQKITDIEQRLKALQVDMQRLANHLSA